MSNNFKVYVGIAVEDRVLKSRQLKVFLRELTPFAAGPLQDTTRSEKFSIKNEKDEAVSGNVGTTTCVVADYLGIDTNRFFPPDIVTGEQVLVLQYADEDEYYWTSLGRDDNLRRGELIRWAASDDMAVNKTLNENNTYFVEIDTKLEKRIRVHTSKSDGETYTYDLVIDAKNNYVKLNDSIGNMIELESGPKRIKLTNAIGATVNIDNTDIDIIAPKNIMIRAGQSIIISAPRIIKNGLTRGGNIYKIGGKKI